MSRPGARWDGPVVATAVLLGAFLLLVAVGVVTVVLPALEDRPPEEPSQATQVGAAQAGQQ